MPIKNGIDTIVEILKINKFQKIIFISTDLTIKEQAISLGAHGFILKPINVLEMLKIIKKVSNEDFTRKEFVPELNR